MTYDVIIIGAGIIGCACARECAIAGLRVAIVERDVPGGATTAVGMGHVVVMDDTPAQLALTRSRGRCGTSCGPNFLLPLNLSRAVRCGSRPAKKT
jgi:glycine/D-amino acid oxidase-like deaminating enzyme